MDIEERKNNLTEEEKRVLLEGETETPFTGALLDEKRDGMYRCKVCGTLLFGSDTKFDSGTGWPSFDQAIPGAIEHVEDTQHRMKRTEARCAVCHSHLGHIFDDGPTETGKRYCMNSVSLDFEEEK
jgi:peptide-methionine (R)-S-oxide reductase